MRAQLRRTLPISVGGRGMHVEIDLPEVPSPDALANYWLDYFFTGTPSQNYQINALASTFMRLVEAAIVEYRMASAALRDVWTNQTSLGLGAMHRSISHFESCLSDMHRATNAYRRLRRHKAIDALSLFLAAEKPGFATDSVARQLRLIRDGIHHLEEMIVEGRIAEGEPIALKPDGPEVPHPTEPGQTVKTFDRLVIGDRQVSFQNIAAWLGEMSATATKISQFKPKLP